jgi:L-lactate dehydrogenase complex protein LldF
MSSPRLWRLAQRAAGLGRFLARGGPTLPAALPPPASAWTRSRDLPAPPRETFTARWAREHRS